MQTTSAVYKSIVSGMHMTETKAVIDGTEYFGENDLFSVRITGGLFNRLSIGGTASREVDIVFMPKGKIQRGAKIEVYIRIFNEKETSEWIKVGVFFFSTRSTDRVTGIMTVHGFDPMLKAEGTFLDAKYDGYTWPMPASSAVQRIAGKIDIPVDERTELNPNYFVPCPIKVDEKGNESGSFPTMREVLSQIAIASGGNWIITPQGTLLLVGLNSQPESTHYLVTNYGAAILLGNCRILI